MQFRLANHVRANCRNIRPRTFTFDRFPASRGPQMDWYFRHALLGCWIGLVISAYAELVWSQEEFTPPTSPRECYNFNLDWKFIRAETPNADVPGFEAPEFDDSRWTKISTPHTFNDVDSFRTIISHSGGDRGAFKGLGFYRKHFKLPQSGWWQSIPRIRRHAPSGRDIPERQGGGRF